MQTSLRVALIVAILPLILLAQSQSPGASSVKTEELASLEYPWGMAYLPDGRLLITEKPGRLRIFAEGKLSEPVANVPKVAYRGAEGEQGGLLDVAVDPDFAQSRAIYLSYSEEAGTAPKADPDQRFLKLDVTDTRIMGGVVARARLEGNQLEDLRVIWKQEPKTVGRGHFGNRIAFGRDGTLFITSGERMRFDPAQQQNTSLGKVVRINRDGSAPKDNPFAGKAGARDEIWSLGHRNMLAVAVQPSSGQLWVAEMGPLGGDELNLVERSANYGWPVVSDGDNYDKSPIPDHRTRPEFKAPVKTWTPVISPSGAMFYVGSLFPWKDNLILGGLSAKGLIRLTIESGQVTSEERLDLQRRIRDVIEAPDGAVLVITDEQKGALLRLTPPASAK
jgi:glucose/arabinose dehydrogenase